MVVREYRESDHAWAEAFLDEFGGRFQARRGELIDVLALPGFVAERDGRPSGLVTYRRESDECELAFIGALNPHKGTGTALLNALLEALAGCSRIWLSQRMTTWTRFASINGAASSYRRFALARSTSRVAA